MCWDVLCGGFRVLTLGLVWRIRVSDLGFQILGLGRSSSVPAAGPCVQQSPQPARS